MNSDNRHFFHYQAVFDNSSLAHIGFGPSKIYIIRAISVENAHIHLTHCKICHTVTR